MDIIKSNVLFAAVVGNAYKWKQVDNSLINIYTNNEYSIIRLNNNDDTVTSTNYSNTVNIQHINDTRFKVKKTICFYYNSFVKGAYSGHILSGYTNKIFDYSSDEKKYFDSINERIWVNNPYASSAISEVYEQEYAFNINTQTGYLLGIELFDMFYNKLMEIPTWIYDNMGDEINWLDDYHTYYFVDMKNNAAGIMINKDAILYSSYSYTPGLGYGDINNFPYDLIGINVYRKFNKIYFEFKCKATQDDYMKEIYFGLREGYNNESSFIPFYKHTYETPVFVRKNQIFTIQWADDLDLYVKDNYNTNLM